MSDSFVKVRDLYPRRRSRLPLIGGFIAAVFLATLLIGGFVTVTNDQTQMANEIP